MNRSVPRALLTVAIVVPLLAGCPGGASGFTAAVANHTDRSWTVTVTLAYADNGTEVFNRTLTLAANERVALDGFRQQERVNVTAEGRLEDGRTASIHLHPFHFQSSASVQLHIWMNDLDWVTGVT